MFRTDSHRNPTAFTTDIAREAGLIEGIDYEKGDPFSTGDQQSLATLWTARLLGDPITITIRVINAIGFRTVKGTPRWTYINLPSTLWNWLPNDQPASDELMRTTYITKKDIIGFMYSREGGTEMLPLFPRIIR